MDKKKRLIQLTEGILLCCVIVVMTLLCIGIIKKEVKNTKGKLTETTGWYRIQENKPFEQNLLRTFIENRIKWSFSRLK